MGERKELLFAEIYRTQKGSFFRIRVQQDSIGQIVISAVGPLPTGNAFAFSNTVEKIILNPSEKDCIDLYIEKIKKKLEARGI